MIAHYKCDLLLPLQPPSYFSAFIAKKINRRYWKPIWCLHNGV